MIKKKTGETEMVNEDGEDSNDANSQSEDDCKNDKSTALVKRNTGSDEIKATVRIKSVRTVAVPNQKMKEQEDECKQTTHAILTVLFICQAMIIIFSFHNIYALSASDEEL